MSIPAKFRTSKEAKAAGWFSRRHRTSEAHDAAQQKRQDKEFNKRFRYPADRSTGLRSGRVLTDPYFDGFYADRETSYPW